MDTQCVTSIINTRIMVELFLLPFFQRALLVGLLLGILLATLGVIVVLRRMSFFADAIGHSALTGIALGILLEVNPFLAALAFTLLVALVISIVRERTELHLDTLLGIFFPTAVAIGVILIQRTPGYQTDLINILFGDILTVSTFDVIASIILSGIVLVSLAIAGKRLLTITLDPDLAHTEGIPVALYELILLLILAAVIALTIKLVGILLVTAMMIIPAATAQNTARSMVAMFSISIVVSIIATTTGMLSSAALNVPSGPAIVLAAAVLFALSLVSRSFMVGR
jgi:ABC-type Mn2+/Zn2+ transport system permease subunit